MRLRFDDFTRQAAAALDRRSLLGVVSTALLTAGVTPQAVTAKKHGGKKKGCKNLTKRCRQEFLENCHDSDVDNPGACTDAINQCCKQCKGKSENQLFDKCADV